MISHWIVLDRGQIIMGMLFIHLFNAEIRAPISFVGQDIWCQIAIIVSHLTTHPRSRLRTGRAGRCFVQPLCVTTHVGPLTGTSKYTMMIRVYDVYISFYSSVKQAPTDADQDPQADYLGP